MSAGRRGGWIVVATFALLSLQAAPGLALASSGGEITRAQVTPGWTLAGIAGIASTTLQAEACTEPPEPPEPPREEPVEGEEWEGAPPEEFFRPETCSWIPYATVGPGASQADCSSPGRRRDSLGEGVQLVWAGDEMENPGSISFDLSGVLLNYGSSSPLLCLSATEAVLEAMYTGECPFGSRDNCFSGYSVVETYQQLDSALLEPVASPTEKPASGPAQETVGPSLLVPHVKARHCRTATPRRKGKASRAKGGHKPSKLCLGRLTKVD
jgi:hypothetical protein